MKRYVHDFGILSVVLSLYCSSQSTQLRGAMYSDLLSFNGCLKTSDATCTLAAGTYTVTTPLLATGANLIIEGQGQYQTVLRRGDTSVLRLLELSSSASNALIRSLQFDGNKGLWFGPDGILSHAELKTFLTGALTQEYQDVKLNSAINVRVDYCQFLNSARYALHFSGSSAAVTNSGFTGGLDAAIRSYSTGPFLTSLLIYGNSISSYRGAGIILDRVSDSWVMNNTLLWNHSGDVWGGDIDQQLQGGGQVYSANGAHDNIISGNSIDGLADFGYQVPNNDGASLTLNNYGVELDSGQPTYNTTLSGNTVSRHGVAGYWIGGSVSGVVLNGETVTSNKVNGVQIEGSAAYFGVKIKGGSIQSNGGWPWPNGSDRPRGYGIHLWDVGSNGVCIQSDVSLTGNTSGETYSNNAGTYPDPRPASCT